MSEDTPTKVPFSAQAVWDGYWEFYHDDDCDAVLDPDTKVCSACGWRPDLQSMGARRTGKDVGGNQSSAPLPSSEGTVTSKDCICPTVMDGPNYSLEIQPNCRWCNRKKASEGTVKSDWEFELAPESLKDPVGLIEWHLRKYEGVRLTEGTRNVIKDMLRSVVEQDKLRRWLSSQIIPTEVPDTDQDCSSEELAKGFKAYMKPAEAEEADKILASVPLKSETVPAYDIKDPFYASRHDVAGKRHTPDTTEFIETSVPLCKISEVETVPTEAAKPQEIFYGHHICSPECNCALNAMNSESETVEERAQKFAEIAKKYHLGSDVPEGDGWSWNFEPSDKALAAFEEVFAMASSLLQKKEQRYKDEREAQREFYLPANPTAEDISQARAIIAQQKSKLLEKEQRIKS